MNLIEKNNLGAIRDRHTGEFRQYDSHSAGLSAIAHDLLAKYDRGLNTLSKVMERYAPYGDGNNNPRIYADAIAGHMRKVLGRLITRNTPLNLHDPHELSAMISKIVGVETGRHHAASESEIGSAAENAINRDGYPSAGTELASAKDTDKLAHGRRHHGKGTELAANGYPHLPQSRHQDIVPAQAEAGDVGKAIRLARELMHSSQLNAHFLDNMNYEPQWRDSARDYSALANNADPTSSNQPPLIGRNFRR